MISTISNAALAARLRQAETWMIEASSSQVKLTKQFGRKHTKVVSFMLERQTNGLYYLAPVTYEFHSKLSHFDYSMSEERWAREKRFFKNVFGLLKSTNTLKYVENADTFIKVNTFNKDSDKTALQGQLRDIKTLSRKKTKK